MTTKERLPTAETAIQIILTGDSDHDFPYRLTNQMKKTDPNGNDSSKMKMKISEKYLMSKYRTLNAEFDFVLTAFSPGNNCLTAHSLAPL